MTPRRFLRAVEALLQAEGSRLLWVEHNKHQKLTIQTPAGPRLLVISRSPSDSRVLGQVRKDIRKLLRGTY